MPSIEQLWVVEAAYAGDAAERREPVRAEHLARVGELIDQGVVVVAGAYGDMSASLLLVRADSEDAAIALCHDDVYWRTGVWTGVSVRALNRVLPD